MSSPIDLADVAAQREVEQELRERLALETMVAELAERFVSADSRGLDQQVRETQARLCEGLGFDACGIWQSRDDDPDTIAQTHVFARTQLPARPSGMTARVFFPWVEQQLRATGKPVIIPDTSALPSEAATDRETYARYGIGCTLCVPSYSADGALRGVVTCSAISPRELPPLVISRAETIARIMLMALERERSDRRLAADRERMRLLNERLEAELAERDRAAETLRISEGKFRTAFMTGIDAMYLATRDEGRFVDCNSQFGAIFGYEREEVLGQTSLGLHLFDDPNDRGRMIATLEAQGVVREFELWGRKKGGERILLSLSVSPLRMGSVPHTLGVISDITQRERARVEQVKLEDQLRQSQKMESIGRLAGGVAHDFNNLLSVILSYAGFALEEVREGDPLRDDLLEVQKAGERAASLTRQLLAFSRKQILAPVALDINRVVRDLEQMLQRLLGEDVGVVVRLAQNLGAAMIDPGQLEQLLMNLVVNARDAMPRGGRLTIETSNVDLDEDTTSVHGTVKKGHHVMIAVSDTGCGMDSATQERIFEPFFTTKERGKGTGLGLSTVFGIVKQSGGDVWVCSEVGRGTTFKVYLPRVSAPASETTRRAAAPVSTGTETVLIVEDEPAVRRIAERILRSAGYHVLSTGSGGDALLLGEPIDLLLTDVVMPRMSGPELAERLSKVRPALKVLYMSGYTDDAIAHHGVLAPGTRFVGKPFAAAELTRKVREVLDEG